MDRPAIITYASSVDPPETTVARGADGASGRVGSPSQLASDDVTTSAAPIQGDIGFIPISRSVRRSITHAQAAARSGHRRARGIGAAAWEVVDVRFATDPAHVVGKRPAPRGLGGAEPGTVMRTLSPPSIVDSSRPLRSSGLTRHACAPCSRGRRAAAPGSAPAGRDDVPGVGRRVRSTPSKPAAEEWMEHDEIAGLLDVFEGGDRDALDRLLPFVYDELRRIAHRELQRERQGHTLSTTEVVHEAYLKLAEHQRVTSGEQVRFLAVAATAVRRALVEHARRRDAAKRGGGQRAVTLDEEVVVVAGGSEDLLSLDEALTRLAALDDRLARVVECRYFGGLTEDETASALGVTARTVRRDWVKAKAWLFRELHGATS